MPKKVIVELTNRCNLNCYHCFTGRHGGRDDLPLAVLEQILAQAKLYDFTQIGFTGGDPTIYRQFARAVQLTCEAGYQWGFNTNGWNFAQTYAQLLPYREQLTVITFSLDGASQATHDQLRGQGSYRRVLQAMSICVVHELPFTVNMVITAHNRHELAAMAQLVHQLGGQGLRFGHLMPSPITTGMDFDLSPEARKVVEAEIHELRRQAPLPIAMAPGYHTTDLFPCAPLHLQELNIDCQGNLTTCCHLSGHGSPEASPVGNNDLIGNLTTMSFSELYQQLVAENRHFHQQKRARLAAGAFQDADYFTCWYCFNHYKKVDWLQKHQTNHWQPLIWQGA